MKHLSKYLNKHLNKHLYKKKTKIRLCKEFTNEIKTDEKYISDELFWKCFKSQSPSLLAKDLFKAKNDKLVTNINDAFIELRNATIMGAIPEKENTNKIVDTVEKILDLNKQQKSKGLLLDFYHSKHKILSYKQMLQILPITLAQVKAGNTSETLIDEIRQIIYSLYREKEVIKQNGYNNYEF